MTLLKQIAETIADGHYHTVLRDRFVEVLRIEGLEQSAEVFARLPERSDYGVLSGWAESALNYWITTHAKGKQ